MFVHLKHTGVGREHTKLGRHVFPLEGVALRVDDKRAHPPLGPFLPFRIGEHDDGVGDRAVGDQIFHAAEQKSVAVATVGARHLQRIRAGVRLRQAEGERTFAARGTPLCETIYGGIFQKMSETAISLSPDLYSWMIIEGYGKTLSRNGAPIVLRELATVGILAVLGWQRQLFSHIRGAINVGATADEVLHAVYVCHFLAESKYAVALETFNEAIRKK